MLFFLPSFDYPFHFMAPFLAMAKLKQAWLCSSGLTKTFVKMSQTKSVLPKDNHEPCCRLMISF